MPRLIPPVRGNGYRPSDERYKQSNPVVPGEGWDIVVLDVSDDTHEKVGQAHYAALDPNNEDVGLLTLHVVLIDNPSPIDGSDGSVPTFIRIGASTLHEAATEAIGAYTNLAQDMPQWVASSSTELAKVIAEHFTVKGYNECQVRDWLETIGYEDDSND